MIPIFSQYSIPPLISAAIFLFFGFYVLRKNYKNFVNIIFFLSCFVTAWWQATWFVLFNVYTIGMAQLLVKVGYFGIILIPVLFYHFFISFVYKDHPVKKIDKYFLTFSYIAAGIFEFFLLTSNLFIDGYYRYDWGFYPKAGMLHKFFLLILFLNAVRMIVLLVNLLRDGKYYGGLKRQHVLYFLAAQMFYDLSVVDFLSNYGIAWYPVGFIFIIIFVMILCYAVVSVRLMGIRFALRQSVVYVATLSLVILLISWMKFFIISYVPEVPYWFDLVLLAISLMIFAPIRNFFYKEANRYFFSSLYDTRTVFASLSEDLSQTLEAQKIIQCVEKIINKSLHPKSFALFDYNEQNGGFDIRYNFGFKFKKKSFRFSRYIVNNYLSKPSILILDDLRTIEGDQYNTFLTEYRNRYGMEVLAPMVLKDKMVGFIALGEKESGDSYNNEDIALLTVISSQAAISIENSFLFEEVKSFNAKLTKEVERATSDLRTANEELKRLDEAKSEFISIASHQLRTPLTVIKGYSSMMLEGSFGDMTPPIQDNVKKIYESSERLATLVEDLLSISRIESGRLVFNYENTHLDELVDSVVDELGKPCSDKNLYLKYNKPDKPLPLAKIDKNKLRQVVLNLIDNSIKYTVSGGITVNLSSDDKFVRFSVTDTGMGINPSDKAHLFQKFSRGTETSLVHTEGTGLGLYVGRMIIEEHGGRIWAESGGENSGATFSFEIPIIK